MFLDEFQVLSAQKQPLCITLLFKKFQVNETILAFNNWDNKKQRETNKNDIL